MVQVISYCSVVGNDSTYHAEGPGFEPQQETSVSSSAEYPKKSIEEFRENFRR